MNTNNNERVRRARMVMKERLVLHFFFADGFFARPLGRVDDGACAETLEPRRLAVDFVEIGALEGKPAGRARLVRGDFVGEASFSTSGVAFEFGSGCEPSETLKRFSNAS